MPPIDPKMSSYKWEPNVNGPPANALPLGHQNDEIGTMYIAAALNTGKGEMVGGKAGVETTQGLLTTSSENMCWYSYEECELKTKEFAWLVAPPGKIGVVKNEGNVPQRAVKLGPQSDGPTEYHPAVAVTQHGLIPGKAQGDTCWYGYDSKEHKTTDFLWVVEL